MEISPVPRRRALPARVRLLLVVVVLAPVTLLALLPTMFGLQRYVIASDDMDGRLGRGSVALEREVASSRLEVGDVITFEAPPGHGVRGLVTHRITAIGPHGLRTRGDNLPEADPWVLPASAPTRTRVVLAVPYVGYPFLHPGTRWVVVGGALAASAALALGTLRRGSGRRARTAGTPVTRRADLLPGAEEAG